MRVQSVPCVPARSALLPVAGPEFVHVSNYNYCKSIKLFHFVFRKMLLHVVYLALAAAEQRAATTKRHNKTTNTPNQMCCIFCVAVDCCCCCLINLYVQFNRIIAIITVQKKNITHSHTGWKWKSARCAHASQKL